MGKPTGKRGLYHPSHQDGYCVFVDVCIKDTKIAPAAVLSTLARVGKGRAETNIIKVTDKEMVKYSLTLSVCFIRAGQTSQRERDKVHI